MGRFLPWGIPPHSPLRVPNTTSLCELPWASPKSVPCDAPRHVAWDLRIVKYSTTSCKRGFTLWGYDMELAARETETAPMQLAS